MTSIPFSGVINDFQSVVYIEVVLQKVWSFLTKLLLTTYSCWLWPTLATDKQPDGSKKLTFVLYSQIWPFRLLSLKHKNLRRSLCSGLTWKLWDICSMSHVTAVCSFLNRYGIPIRPFIISGPCKRCWLRDWSWEMALQLHTIRIWFGFLGW